MLIQNPVIAQCSKTTGTITRGSYRSAIATTTMWYSVYTPPCYDENQALYPALYLLHGSNEDDGQWGRLGIQALLDAGITEGTLPPMIVVMPFGEWLANQNQFDAVSWENVFLNELMPLVEGQYRIDARRELRAIGGISRGGFWAFEIAFRHPDLFSAVGGHSAFFDDYHAPPEYNPLRLAQDAPGLDTLRIWLDRGKDDFAAPGLDLMAERLSARGIAHQYIVHPQGQHDASYWRQYVADYLHFYAADWLDSAPVAAMPAITFATNTPQPSAPSSGVYLFLPVTAFPSLQTTITRAELDALRSGQSGARLTLDTSTAAALAGLGVALPPDAQVVLDDALLNTLWRDRTRYTLLPFERLETRYRVLLVDDLHPLDSDLTSYPFAFAGRTSNYDPTRLTRVLFSGVTALTRLTREALDANGIEWAAGGIEGYTQQADFFHISNEVSFSPGCPASDGPTLGAFCSTEAHFELFTRLGVDIVELTGNHNNDYGTEIYLKTLDWYRGQGMLTVGGGETLEQARQPLLLNHNGNRIALVACNWAGPYYALADAESPGAAACEWEWLRATLPALSAANDLVVVTVQYQEYEEYLPTAQQQLDFRGLADLGADVVIGTQAHKPQTMEFYNAATGAQRFIHYGLGNLYFDQPFWGNMRFFMDRLLVYEGRLVSIDLFTGIIDDNARPRPMNAEERFNFLAFMFNTQAAL
ncbi:MAG: CapA family protein [Anaerolineae bacterium]|nr:CapA family protein [Anaerolineae bacterium]